MVSRLPNAFAGDVLSLRNAVDRVFNESMAPGRTWSLWSGENRGGSGTLPMDVYATDTEAIVLASVPGVDPEKIEIQIDRNVVTIKGQIANAATSEEGKQATWYLHELPYGSFSRSLKLPWEIDLEAADATFQHGLLRLTLPKAEAERPKQIRVRVEAATTAETEPAIASEVAEPASAE